ncbi:MAG: hypothetical protein RBT37_04545 [Dissulfurispiraceae bacterium]|jgi:hypothetical protein|nr:hypothetical protein [Dissulfurispiraceae bacterium]
MQIGFLIINPEFVDSIFELLEASLKRGHSIRVFMTDAGVKLLENKLMLIHASSLKIQINFCSHSAKKHHVDTSILPKEMVPSTQYQNALMHNECDRVLIF